jgi:hypothetical protein
MFAAACTVRVGFRPTLKHEIGLERNRTEVVDGDVTRHRDDIAVTIGFAHSLIEQGSNDAAMCVAGRSLELRAKMDAAENAIFFIHKELQVQTGGVVLAAAEAAIEGAMRQRDFARGGAFCHSQATGRETAPLRYTRIQIWR